MARPGHVSPLTDAVHKAHAHLIESYGIADRKHATIPLMHETLDPRTARKYKEQVHQLFEGNEPGLSGPVQQKTKQPTRSAPHTRKEMAQTSKNKLGGYPAGVRGLESATIDGIDSPGPYGSTD